MCEQVLFKLKTSQIHLKYVRMCIRFSCKRKSLLHPLLNPRKSSCSPQNSFFKSLEFNRDQLKTLKYNVKPMKSRVMYTINLLLASYCTSQQMSKQAVSVHGQMYKSKLGIKHNLLHPHLAHGSIFYRSMQLLILRILQQQSISSCHNVEHS